MGHDIEFRQGRPFFDMVGSFLISVAGSPSIIEPGNLLKLEERHIIALPGKITGGRHIKPREVHDLAVLGNLSHSRFVQSCCAMLANTAYEAVKDENDLSPEFEFFRHVRNASSHGNQFYFRKDQPSRPASWRSATIDHTRQGSGNPLQGSQCFGAYLDVADLLELLWDIEQRIAV